MKTLSMAVITLGLAAGAIHAMAGAVSEAEISRDIPARGRNTTVLIEKRDGSGVVIETDSRGSHREFTSPPRVNGSWQWSLTGSYGSASKTHSELVEGYTREGATVTATTRTPPGGFNPAISTTQGNFPTVNSTAPTKPTHPRGVDSGEGSPKGGAGSQGGAEKISIPPPDPTNTGAYPPAQGGGSYIKKPPSIVTQNDAASGPLRVQAAAPLAIRKKEVGVAEKENRGPK